MPSLSRYQFHLAQHLRDPHHRPRPEGLPARGTQVYGELLFNNVCGFLDRCFPVCRSVLGERRWRRLCRHFYRDAVCTSPWFRDIPAQFAEHLDAARQAMPLPAWLSDLARYEWAELAVDVMAVDIPAHAPAGDPVRAVPVLQPARRVLLSDWPLQRIGPACRPRQRQPTCLLVFRGREDEVRFIECNALATQLLAELAQGRTGAQAVQALAQASGLDDASAWWPHGAAVLAQWQAQGLILGTRT